MQIVTVKQRHQRNLKSAIHAAALTSGCGQLGARQSGCVTDAIRSLRGRRINVQVRGQHNLFEKNCASNINGSHGGITVCQSRPGRAGR